MALLEIASQPKGRPINLKSYICIFIIIIIIIIILLLLLLCFLQNKNISQSLSICCILYICGLNCIYSIIRRIAVKTLIKHRTCSLAIIYLLNTPVHALSLLLHFSDIEFQCSLGSSTPRWQRCRKTNDCCEFLLGEFLLFIYRTTKRRNVCAGTTSTLSYPFLCPVCSVEK